MLLWLARGCRDDALYRCVHNIYADSWSIVFSCAAGVCSSDLAFIWVYGFSGRELSSVHSKMAVEFH